MWTMARPGDMRQLPEAGLSPIVEALIDLECSAYGDNSELRRLIGQTGANVAAEPAAADHVFLERFHGEVETLATVRCGSALYPDDGATVVIAAPIGQGTRLQMRGAGIERTSDLAIGLPPAFWQLRERLCLYPEGFDLFVVDGRNVVGIPRSTTIEVL
jgi:alpha-D-ribose 1-methylphosphonate 5-triphosphate synthase subunit PhnH